MSALRLYRPRAFRPYLSTRYQCLHRAESTVSQPTLRDTTTSPPPPPPPPPTQGFLARNRTPLIFGTLSLCLGLFSGAFVLHTIAPPPLPKAGTHEDGILVADLNKRIDEEFKVKVLRGKCLGVAKQLKGAEGGWVEILSPPPPPHEESTTNTSKTDGLVSLLQGAKGLGVQRLFFNRQESKLVAVIWVGPALSGWPGVTHGGVIATEFSEKLALAAYLSEQHHNTDAVSTAAAIPQRMPGTGNHAKMFAPAHTPVEPAELSLSYVKPTLANNFYVIRVSPAIPLDQDPEHIVPAEPAGGHEFEATLETMDARINAKAKARFVPRSTTQRVQDQTVQAARTTYADFKQWLWPSRQESSQLN